MRAPQDCMFLISKNDFFNKSLLLLLCVDNAVDSAEQIINELNILTDG